MADFGSPSAIQLAGDVLRVECRGPLHGLLHEPLHERLRLGRSAMEQMAVNSGRQRLVETGLHFCLSDRQRRSLGGQCGSSVRCRRSVPGMSSLSSQSRW